MRHISRYQLLAVMLLCMLLAAALRLPNLQTAPPGLHYDEAANGVLAGDIGLRGARPVFIPSYTGKEVFFFYLAGGLMRLVGESVFTLRLTSAFISLLTIAAAYWLGRELFKDSRVAMLAAVLLAVSFWHLIFSRLGFRAVAQPMLQAMTAAALYRGLRRQDLRWMAGGGVLLGLTAYTYLAARIFPFLLLTGLLPLLFSRREAKLRWKQLSLSLAAAVVVLAPLIDYFMANPDAFWVRISQVATETGQAPLTYGQSFVRSLQMFFLTGDPYWRFNVPGRPLFDWFWGGLMVFGWLSLLVGWRRLDSDWRRGGALMLLAAPIMMLLPTALATSEIVPSNLRAIGLMPFIFYLPAFGLTVLLQAWETRWKSVQVWPGLLAAGATLMVGSAAVGIQYFRQWGVEPALFYESDGDLAAIAVFLEEHELDQENLFVAALHYRHPTLAFLSDRYEQVRWLPNSEALVFPASSAATYLFPHNSPAPDWAMPFLEEAVPLDVTSGPDGQPSFLAYRLAQAPSMTVPNLVQANFGNVITLLGYEIEPAAGGQPLPVTLYWQVESAPPANYTPFIHLQDGWQQRWAQVETFAYPAEQWRIGDMIVQRVEIEAPPGTPPGFYRLQVGLFEPDGGQRLARLDDAGRYAGDTYIIEGVPVAAGPLLNALPVPPLQLNLEAAPGLTLLGYERGGEKVATGEAFPLALWWKAVRPQRGLTTRLEMRLADNSGRILLDTQPVHGTYPFPSWQPPQFVIDHVDPRIPNRFPAGEYQLHLRLLDSSDQTVLEADLGALTVETTERVFNPPAMSHPLSAVLGNEIELLGYELEQGDKASHYTLTLAWRARVLPAADYTVFVHLLNIDGSCCLWQQDAMPRQNQYPTSRWLRDEVVMDHYQLELPPDTPAAGYPIELGLYIGETGRRLQVTQPGMAAGDAVNLLPLPVE